MASDNIYSKYYNDDDVQLASNSNNKNEHPTDEEHNSLAITKDDQLYNKPSLEPSALDDGHHTELFHALEQKISVHLDQNKMLNQYVENVYHLTRYSKCPFTQDEINELKTTNELLVYLPARWTGKELCDHFKIQSNINFDNEKLISNTMVNEDQWFIAKNSNHPEMLYQNATKAKESYDAEGLLGFDLRRYLAFCGTFKYFNGFLPDDKYWTFLLSGRYDQSGISIVGFDKYGVLSHHGWMKNFKAKFCGSRYIVIAPRIEINDETIGLKRAYRGKKDVEGHEAHCS